MRMRNEFKKENEQRRHEKKEREKQMLSDNKEFKINFFPFTHGEHVENKRINQREDQKEVILMFFIAIGSQKLS